MVREFKRSLEEASEEEEEEVREASKDDVARKDLPPLAIFRGFQDSSSPSPSNETDAILTGSANAWVYDVPEEGLEGVPPPFFIF